VVGSRLKNEADSGGPGTVGALAKAP